MSSRKLYAPPALGMIERAFFLVRAQPAEAWAVLAAGQVPLLLSVLYLLVDTATSGYAGNDSRAPFEALLCAVCFLWFNVCRARFSQFLSAALTDERPGRARSAFDTGNLAVQSGKLFAMPLAFLATVPLSWAVAFFRTRTVLCSTGDGDTASSAKIAGAWPRQSWGLLLALSLFSVVVFINVLILVAAAPSLVKIVSGVENDFTRLGFTINGVVLESALGLTWLILDPLYQSVYTVRAFLVESRTTGLDLKSLIRHVMVLIVVAGIIGGQARAQQPPDVNTAPIITGDQLDRSIDRVLERPEYAWRIPRRQEATPSFVDRILQPIRKAFHAVADWIGRVLDKLFRNSPPLQAPGKPMQTNVRYIMLALLAVFVVAGGLAALRFARPRAEPVDAGVTAAAPLKLEDEHISAADLPEDGWIAMARDCAARGEYRLAMRALFLANISFLGRRDLVTIAPFKSNRDYCNELRRRARNQAVQDAFTGSVRVFERGWYGTHPVDEEQVSEFERGFLRMKAYVEA